MARRVPGEIRSIFERILSGPVSAPVESKQDQPNSGRRDVKAGVLDPVSALFRSMRHQSEWVRPSVEHNVGGTTSRAMRSTLRPHKREGSRRPASFRRTRTTNPFDPASGFSPATWWDYSTVRTADTSHGGNNTNNASRHPRVNHNNNRQRSPGRRDAYRCLTSEIG